MSIEDMVRDVEKNLAMSDLHGQFLDKKAWKVTLSFIKDWKPDRIIVNGDLVDFYSISRYDKNPDRKEDLQYEMDLGNEYLKELREAAPKAELVVLEGNHENRLQLFLWQNPKLKSIRGLDLPTQFGIKEVNATYVGVDRDYWKKTNGHFKVADMIITHGDNQLNGARVSAKSGYSANNTMTTMQTSVAIGHVHRQGLVYQHTPYGDLVGMELGCLCKVTGTANWQQGFGTFLSDGKKTFDHQLRKITKGVMYANGKVYKA